MSNKNHFVSALSGSPKITFTWTWELSRFQLQTTLKVSCWRRLCVFRMAEQKEPKLLFTRDSKRNRVLDLWNEMRWEMSLSVLRDIVESIKNADFHSFMVDETSDVENIELAGFLCFLGRWKSFFIWEYFRSAWNGELIVAANLQQ